MRLLLISFYFPPDLSAGSFRATALVKALCANLNGRFELEVCTTQPNRYRSFTQSVQQTERNGPVTIHRFAVPGHSSGMFDQSRAYLVFAWAVWRQTRSSRFDAIMVTSGRLMSAVLGSAISRQQGTPLFLDIRDIFLETICGVLHPARSLFIRPIVSVMERFAINRADWVNLVSAGFAPHFTSRYPGRTFSYYTNGIDPDFLDMDLAVGEAPRNKIQKVVYAGNIGESQALHTILPDLALRTEGRLHFVVVGDGGKRGKLEQALAAARVTNVELRNPVARKELRMLYSQTDILFLHLADKKVFQTVLPSKLFEYAASQKPIWAGVAGTAADFIATEIPNAAVFKPGDVQGALTALDRLEPGAQPRNEFVEKYSRNNIMDNMVKEVIAKITSRHQTKY